MRGGGGKNAVFMPKAKGVIAWWWAGCSGGACVVEHRKKGAWRIRIFVIKFTNKNSFLTFVDI